MTPRHAKVLAACIAAMFSVTPALAQRALQPKPLTAPKAEQQPAALPGASGSPARVERGTAKTDLAPNEALFDAVNRGDLPGVREAVNRGANLSARNILGLTAIELSVDLGRNPITFFLLSVRAGSEGTAAAAPAEPNLRVAAPSPAPQPAASRPGAVQSVAAPQPAPAPKPAPRQALSQDPGVPAPQVGFLGFGPSH